MTSLRLQHLLLLITALAGTSSRAEAQSDPSPWRFGVSLGGGTLLGIVAEYWSDDIGVGAKLGTLGFQDVSAQLSPKWRVSAWDGGEASWRAGVLWYPSGGVFVAFHGVELASVTDGGHVTGWSYNLPLFGTFQWDESVGETDESPDTGNPEEGPEVDTEDPERPSPWLVGTAASAILNFLLGEFTYRYQPGG